MVEAAFPGAAVATRKHTNAIFCKLGKQLKTVQNTVDEAGRRTRAVERKLRDVETLEIGAPEPSVLDDVLLELDAFGAAEGEEDDEVTD